MSNIAASAQIDPSAMIAEDVEIGAYAIIHKNVKIGRGCKISPHAVVHENTTLGEGNILHSFACVGTHPQVHHKEKAPGYLLIGNNNVFHEFVTVSRGCDGNKTELGNNNLLQAYSHVGHDARLQDHIVLVNYAAVAGHVEIASHAIIGAFCGVHQFCKIGESAMISHGALVTKDVMPFVMVMKNPPKCYGLNKVGLKRRAFSDTALKNLKQAYRLIFRTNMVASVIADELKGLTVHCEKVATMVKCLEESERGIVR